MRVRLHPLFYTDDTAVQLTVLFLSKALQYKAEQEHSMFWGTTIHIS